jgi:hypothetical protein
MDMVESTLDATTFSKNGKGLLAHDVACAFFRAVIEQAHRQRARDGGRHAHRGRSRRMVADQGRYRGTSSPSAAVRDHSPSSSSSSAR